MHQLGYPLLISSTVAPEPLFERLRSSGGYIFLVGFLWGRASDPVGVAPEPLEGFFDPSEGYVTYSAETLSMSIMNMGWKPGLACFAQGLRRTPGGASVVSPRLSSLRVIQVRTHAPFEGVGCSPEASS